jgi:hypothetical protein
MLLSALVNDNYHHFSMTILIIFGTYAGWAGPAQAM